MKNPSTRLTRFFALLGVLFVLGLIALLKNKPEKQTLVEIGKSYRFEFNEYGARTPRIFETFQEAIAKKDQFGISVLLAENKCIYLPDSVEVRVLKISKDICFVSVLKGKYSGQEVYVNKNTLTGL